MSLISDSFIFTGQKITLRKITLSDVNRSYIAWLNDAEVTKYLETRWVPQTFETVEGFVHRAVNSTDEYLLAIIENYTSQHIGNLKIGPVNPHHKYADLSYFIGNKEYWRNGFATEAVQGAVAWAFHTLGLHSIRAGIYAGNVASRKVLEKCGFQERGAFPSELVTDDGREDHVFFSCVNPTYQIGSVCK